MKCLNIIFTILYFLFFVATGIFIILLQTDSIINIVIGALFIIFGLILLVYSIIPKQEESVELETSVTIEPSVV